MSEPSLPKTILTYSNTGAFSLKSRYTLSPSFETHSLNGRGVIPRDTLISIFSSRRKAVPGSRSPVIAKVEIVENGPDGVSRLRLLESARLES